MKVKFLYLILFLTMLAPAWALGFGLPTLHIGDPLIFIAVIFLIKKGLVPLIAPPDLRLLTIPHLFILLYILFITVLVSPIFPQYVVLLTASIFASFSLFKPFLLLILIVGLGLNSLEVRRLGRFVIVLIFLELGLIYCQNFDLFGVNQWLSPYYTIEELTAEYTAGRFFGSFGNPNDFGTAMSVLATLLFARVLLGPGTFARVICALAIVLTVICLVLYAKTRQGTICLLGGCFVVQMFVLFKSGRRSWAIFILFISVAAIVIGIGILQVMPKLSERFAIFTSGGSVLEEESVTSRYPYLLNILSELGPFLITGKGMMEMVIRKVYDSGYVSILAIGGIPCLIAFMFMLFGPFISAKRRLLHNGLMHPDSWLHVGSLAAIVPIALTNLINVTLNNGRIFSTIMIVYGLSFAAMRAQDAEEELFYMNGE